MKKNPKKCDIPIDLCDIGINVQGVDWLLKGYQMTDLFDTEAARGLVGGRQTDLELHVAEAKDAPTEGCEECEIFGTKCLECQLYGE